MIISDKPKLREFFQKKRLLLSPLKTRQMNRDICKRILSLKSFSTKKTVACYIAANNEPDIKTVIDRLIKNKKTVAAPAFFKKTKDYEFVKFENFQNLTLGPYKILQPQNAPIVNPADIELALVPAVAFSQNGLRLGYGKGVYDRLLANSNALKIGIAYDFQVIDQFESEAHDIRVDFVVTEKRIIKT